MVALWFYGITLSGFKGAACEVGVSLDVEPFIFCTFYVLEVDATNYLGLDLQSSVLNRLPNQGPIRTYQ